MKIKARYFIILALLIPHDIVSLTVHVIGDSHAFFCFNNTQSGITADEISTFLYAKNGLNISLPFYIHWLGSRTMHRVGRDKLQGLNIKKLGVKEGDVAIFLFGEVDVRCHIGRQRDEKRRTQGEIIETLAQNYLSTIAANKKLYTDVTCIVASVTPPCDRGFNPSFPFYGPLSERVAITQELNNCLCNFGKQHEINFLDIYSIYTQQDGSLGLDLSDGIIHINPKYNNLIKEKLIDLITKLKKLG